MDAFLAEWHGIAVSDGLCVFVIEGEKEKVRGKQLRACVRAWMRGMGDLDGLY